MHTFTRRKITWGRLHFGSSARMLRPLAWISKTTNWRTISETVLSTLTTVTVRKTLSPWSPLAPTSRVKFCKCEQKTCSNISLEESFQFSCTQQIPLTSTKFSSEHYSPNLFLRDFSGFFKTSTIQQVRYLSLQSIHPAQVVESECEWHYYTVVLFYSAFSNMYSLSIVM